jgi:hypothetical protein
MLSDGLLGNFCDVPKSRTITRILFAREAQGEGKKSEAGGRGLKRKSMVFVGLVVKAAAAKLQQQVTLPSPPTQPKPKSKPFSLSVKPLQTLLSAVAAEQGQKIEKKRTHHVAVHDGPQSTMGSQTAGSIRCSSIVGNAKTKKAKVVGEKNERGDMGQAAMKQAQQNSHLPTGSIPSGARPPPCSAWPGNVGGGIVNEGHSSAVAVLGKRKEGGGSGIEMKRAETKRIPSFSLESSPSLPSSPVKNTHAFKLGSLRFEVAGVKVLLCVSQCVCVCV